MDTFTLTGLIILLVFLILVCAFFSGTETAMMALNRYRLRHQARANNHAAIRVSKLLERPDRLLGVVLIGNTFAITMASAVATVIGATLYGELGIAVATVILSLIVLIFAEVAPKTLAATYPQPLAFAASWPLKWILKVLYPVIWTINALANGMLRLFRIKIKSHHAVEQITREELQILVAEAGAEISDEHQDMLHAILGLEQVTIEDVMIPKSNIVGIDLDAEWSEILHQLTHSQYTRLPLYRSNIDSTKGVIHLRVALNLLAKGILSKKTLADAAESPYFVPESTQLHTQLLNFRDYKLRFALVVDEYGDIQGLVTLEDILEEIVGEFASGISTYRGIREQADGSYLVDGSVNIRDLNRLNDWDLPIKGPKTIGGLVIEHLEFIPQTDVCVKIAGYPMEVMKIKHNRIRVVRIFPAQL